MSRCATGRFWPWVGPIARRRGASSRVDDRYLDAVLMPGFVEGHAHMMAGAMWNYAYAGYQDRVDPDGRRWEGLTDIEA